MINKQKYKQCLKTAMWYMYANLDYPTLNLLGNKDAVSSTK